jgi:hypothetical protein
MLLSVQDLADWLSIPNDSPRIAESLAAAEALAASYIGAESLEETSRSEDITPTRDKTTLPLRFGPLTTLLSVVQDGDELDDIQSDYWMIGTADGFRAGQKYTITYRSGWSNDTGGSPVPTAIRNAILMIAGGIYSRGADGGAKSSERIGDWAASYVTQSGDVFAFITRDAALLLREYRRPGL